MNQEEQFNSVCNNFWGWATQCSMEMMILVEEYAKQASWSCWRWWRGRLSNGVVIITDTMNSGWARRERMYVGIFNTGEWKYVGKDWMEMRERERVESWKLAMHIVQLFYFIFYCYPLLLLFLSIDRKTSSPNHFVRSTFTVIRNKFTCFFSSVLTSFASIGHSLNES